jgi:RNA polymerase sigma factor (sigma-70 family)
MSQAAVTTAAPSWTDLLAAHRGELVHTAQSRLHCRADAEDAVHEVLVRLLRNGRPVADVAAPVAYLRRAVVNECSSRWRRSNRDVLMGSTPDRPYDGGTDRCIDRLLLSTVLPRLTERQRRVLALSFLQDRADAEIAADLGISEVTVRTTRLRALARLRLLLDVPVRTEPVAALAGAAQRPHRPPHRTAHRPGPRRAA